MNQRMYFLIILLFLFFSGTVRAEESASIGDKLSLKKALEIAYSDNPRIVESRKKAKIVEFRFKNSKKLSNPELDIDVGKILNDLEGGGDYDDRNLEGEVRINQPIQTWGKRGLSIGVAEAQKNQAELEFKSVWMDVSRQIKERYAETLLHQKEIELARDGLDRAQRLREQVNIKFNEGKARNHELSRSKLEVANARNDYLKAENEFNISLGQLNVLLGRNMREDLQLKDNLTPKDLEQDFDELLEIALAERADILSQDQEVSKKEKLMKLARRMRLPDVVLGFFVEREDEIYSAGAGVSFELPFWNQGQQDIKEASLEKEIAETNLSALKSQVELDVYISFKNSVLAKKSVANLQEAIKEANELLRIITIEYQEGEASFLIYLEGLASYKDTKKNYLESLANYANKLALLEQTIGRHLNKEEIH